MMGGFGSKGQKGHKGGTGRPKTGSLNVTMAIQAELAGWLASRTAQGCAPEIRDEIRKLLAEAKQRDGKTVVALTPSNAMQIQWLSHDPEWSGQTPEQITNAIIQAFFVTRQLATLAEAVKYQQRD